MDDLISRQAAIRWIKAECNPYNQQNIQRGDLEDHPVGGRADQQHLFRPEAPARQIAGGLHKLFGGEMELTGGK